MDNPDRLLSLTFSDLARDIKLDIFDFVRSKIDQGNARLVNREWDGLMRPRMWTNFATGLRSTLFEAINELPEEEKACIYDIRTLNVGGRHVGPDYHARFSTFMDLLRRDQLQEFISPKETPLDMMQLFNLLHHQSRLRTFRARLDVSIAGMKDVTSWTIEPVALIASALRSVKTLRIYVGDEYMEGDHAEGLQNFAMMCNGLLVRAAPLLRSLEICGWRHTWKRLSPRVRLDALFGNELDAAQIASTLERLVLVDIDLSGAEDELMRAINLEALCSLKLEYCNEMGAFLHALASSVRQTGTRLRQLTIRMGESNKQRGNDDMAGVLEDLLGSFTSLEELECDFHWVAWIDWQNCLGGHHRLDKLHLASGIMGDGYRNWNVLVARILASCSSVQAFAYHSPKLSLEHVIGCSPPPALSDRLCESLEVIAAAPALQTLRLLGVPGMLDDRSNRQDTGWIEKAGMIAHRLATLVLTHLYEQGSNVKWLAISANSRWDQRCADSNLHYYPHYFYRLQISEYDGQNVVTAAPLRDYTAEFPDASIFI